MRKKLKEYSRRFLSVFFVCFTLISFSIPFAHASQVDYDIGLINLFDLQEDYPVTINEGSLKKTRFDFPSGYTNYYYLEFYYYCSDPNHVASLYRNDSYYDDFEVINVSYNFYKAYWSGRTGSEYFNFVVNTTGDLVVSSAFYSNVSLNIEFLPYTVFSNNFGDLNYTDSGTSIFQQSYSAGQTAKLLSSTTGLGQYLNFDNTVYITKSEWANYDFISLHYDFYRYSLGSVNVKINDISVPYSLSYNNNIDKSDHDSVSSHVGNSQLNIIVDVSNIPLTYDNSIAINVTGSYFNQSGNEPFCTISGIRGFNSTVDVDLDIVWYRRIFLLLENWLSVISSKLDIIVGGDPAASDARQTQEEINVSVNNQLVGAVEDWNTNIEVVETGYDLAVTKTTPALVWLSSLADGIFNGMGWFGNVYFLVGLISVLMLLLSKSGLASKIGSISRRRSD